MKVTHGSHLTTITKDSHFEYIEVLDGIFVYRLRTSTEYSNKKVGEVEIVQGATTKKGIRALMTGHPIPNLGPERARPFVCDDTFLREIKKRGISGAETATYRRKSDDTSIYDWVAKGGSLSNIISFDNYDHSYWNLDGTILPTGIHFGYINAHMHNGAYDLEKALEHLQQRGDITFTKERLGDPTEGAILDIPYYNSEEGQDRYLSFFWTPDADQAARIQQNTGDGFKLIFDEDMLGLRAAGAARFDSYYKTGG